MTEENKTPIMTLSQEEQFKIEHLDMYYALERQLTKLSKRDMARMLLAIVAPESQETKRLEKLTSQEVKVAYTLAFKALSVRFARLYAQLVEKQQKEGK